MTSSLKRHLALASVLVVAFAVRVWGLNWALPAIIHWDERNVGGAALEMLASGSICPDFFYHPSLAVLSHYLAAVLAFMIGSCRGLFSTIEDLRLSDCLPYCRFMSAISGVLTVAVVARTARLLRPAASIPAATVASFGFLSVLHSHYATPDIPLSLAVQLTTLLSFEAHCRQSKKMLMLAAVTGGMAASFKYTGAIAVISVLVAAASMPYEQRKMRRIASLALASLLTFLALNTCALLHPETFLDHIGFEAFHYYKAGNLGAGDFASDNPRGVFFHVRAVLGDIGYVAFGFAVFGLIMALRSPLGRKYILILSAYVLPHLALFGSSRAAFPRNALPISPGAAVLAGLGIACLAESIRTQDARRKVIVAATALAIALPARAALLNDYLLTRPCTLSEVQRWFIRNAERLAGPDYKVASIHSLWTPRSPGQVEFSVGDMFLKSSFDGSQLPDPTWFVEQGVVFFTIETWGIERYGANEWPGRIIRLIRQHCFLVEVIEGWPPNPRWFPDFSFASPEVGPNTYFGPTTEIYVFEPNRIRSAATGSNGCSERGP